MQRLLRLKNDMCIRSANNFEPCACWIMLGTKIQVAYWAVTLTNCGVYEPTFCNSTIWITRLERNAIQDYPIEDVEFVNYLYPKG